MEFRAKRVGTESNPAAPVYVKVVETTALTDVVEVELTLPAGAYTVQAKANHWLRGEMAVVSSVPWIFAAPTGATKVTVYWDEVAGATGYRVRWGTVSGSYPHRSAVLPADARQWSITGLVTEQTYYVVVQAEYNGLWGPPSEEDSAVPHVGAIPWDSGDAPAILRAVRNIIGGVPHGELFVLGPDQNYYLEDANGSARSSLPPGYYDAKNGLLYYSDGTVVPITTSQQNELQNEGSGPYRRVRTKSDINAKGATGLFYLPPPIFYNQPYIFVSGSHVNGGKWDAPCIYFGIKSKNADREGGIMFHPAGRRNVPYNRWMPFLAPDVQNNREKNPILGGFSYPTNHIRYEGTYGVGLLVRISFGELLSGKTKAVALFVFAYDAAGPVIWRNVFVGYSRTITGQATVRRVISIAQKLSEEEKKRGYVKTGSFVRNIGVGCVDQNWLIVPVMVLRNSQWVEWTQELTDQAGVFPGGSPPVVRVQEIDRFTYEIVSIEL